MTVGASSFRRRRFPSSIAYAKANPGKISQGRPATGPQHLAGALFKMMTGVNFVHVPYRGASQALTDMLNSGQVQVLFNPAPVH